MKIKVKLNKIKVGELLFIEAKPFDSFNKNVKKEKNNRQLKNIKSSKKSVEPRSSQQIFFIWKI